MPLPIPPAFDLALQHHRAGRLTEAASLYQQILATAPHHADAWHMSGVLAQQMGHAEVAIESIQHALQLDPNNPAAHSNLGEAFRATGRIAEAIASQQRAIQLQPAYAEAHNNLGAALAADGRWEEAIAAYHHALNLQPDYVAAHNNLGVALAALGRHPEAILAFRQALNRHPTSAEVLNNLGNSWREQGDISEALIAYRRALELQPDSAEILNNLGIALARRNDLAEAIVTYRRALQLQPGYAAAHGNLGNALRDQDRLEEAIAAYRRALELQPNNAESASNLGVALADHRQLDEAIAALRRALELKPHSAEIWHNLGNALSELGRLDDALAAFDQALTLQPDHADAILSRSLLWLLNGDFARGLPSYEARWEAFPSTKRTFSQPPLTGEPIQGRRVLIHAEQGAGDAIQFIRYAGTIAAQGGEVIVQCPHPLVNLFRTADGVRQVIANEDPRPPFDLHVPMLSLPLAMRTTPENIPAVVPYLSVDAVRRDAWRQRLGSRRLPRRVGLVWAGNPQRVRLRKRHIALEKLLPLLEVEGLEFISLQLGPAKQQLPQCSPPVPIRDFSEHIHDFADTAALLSELDLIISVDTAMAHLAGALGRSVWTLLPFVPDWRWGLHGDTTAWYPSMRLFRQPTRGDWDSVIHNVVGELKRLAKHEMIPPS